MHTEISSTWSRQVYDVQLILIHLIKRLRIIQKKSVVCISMCTPHKSEQKSRLAGKGRKRK